LISLSDELYAKDTHFIAELIQNCDDNTYPANVSPTLRLELNDRYISIECNEVGFTEENVRALCKVGASTKRDPQGYIGQLRFLTHAWMLSDQSNRRERHW
jgi:hypothetical protein